MITPLSEAMESYIAKNRARFHVPGHKGVLPYFEGLAKYDLTEIDGCDSLYQAESAIKKTEDMYAGLYGGAAALMCAGGSTLCIQAMLALAVKPGGKLIIGRGCHVSAVNAMAILDLTPAWVFPDYDIQTGLAEPPTANQIKAALDENPDASAVYITSPDYYGGLADITAISAVCRESGIPLVVDNAHGAYLRFLTPSRHPINLGADMCCDSLHKTLPVLTGGAMLHIANPAYTPEAKRYMSVFGSTSPSYLVMMSIDRALEDLTSGFPERLCEALAEVSKLNRLAKACGFAVPSGARDPLRITLGFNAKGYRVGEFARLLRGGGIEPEMISESFAVLMAGSDTDKQDFKRLERFIETLPGREAVPAPPPEQIRPKRVKSLREAVFSQCINVKLEDALGKTAASAVAPCPPGIPLAIPGELIDENLTACLKKYGISHINVLQ